MWCHHSYLDTLLGQVSARPVVELHHHQPVAQRLDGPVHSHNPPCALRRHVQVVGNGSGCDLQHVIRSALIQEDLTERREERPRRTTGTEDTRGTEMVSAQSADAPHPPPTTTQNWKLTSRSSGPRCPTWAAACRAAPGRWAACRARRPDPSAATPAGCPGPRPPWWLA